MLQNSISGIAQKMSTINIKTPCFPAGMPPKLGLGPGVKVT